MLLVCTWTPREASLTVRGVSATFLMTAPISKDLNIAFADEAWVLGTYSMVFAATREFCNKFVELPS